MRPFAFFNVSILVAALMFFPAADSGARSNAGAIGGDAASGKTISLAGTH